MAKLRLLGVQEEVVSGLIISADPPDQLCVLIAANGDEIARRTMQASKAEQWAKRECRSIVERVGESEAARLRYDQPMELRIYEDRKGY